MARINRSESSIVSIPKNCSVNQKTGYVLANLTNEYVSENSKGKCSYSSHQKVGIGYAVDPQDWKTNRLMYPNQNYYLHFERNSLPEAPPKKDNISVGAYSVIKFLSESSGLTKSLSSAFTPTETNLILDMATYMLLEESAKFQHYHHWGRGQHLFSDRVHRDTEISTFLRESITVSKINQFKVNWAKSKLADGKVFVCYDSTNVNSQAEGVFLVQKGHAKDDAALDQVNADYVVRQSDGLPLTFMNFPGSVVDVSQAPEMIEFFDSLGKDAVKNITMTCDRGYISERNVEEMDEADIDFLLMLRKDMNCCQRILQKYARSVKKHANYLEDYDEFAMVVSGKLFNHHTESKRSIIIIWNQTLETKHRETFYAQLNKKRKELRLAINRQTPYTQKELDDRFSNFILKTRKVGKMEVRKCGRGNKNKVEIVDSFCVTDFEDDHEAINKELDNCGFRLLASSIDMPAIEGRTAYSKRDCVEKVFQSLKSGLGMDVIGVASDDAIHGKSLVWFVASILYALMNNQLIPLRVADKKHYTVPAAFRSIEEISADLEINSGKYRRRYAPDKRQKAILNACNISIAEVDEIISKMKS